MKVRLAETSVTCTYAERFFSPSQNILDITDYVNYSWVDAVASFELWSPRVAKYHERNLRTELISFLQFYHELIPTYVDKTPVVPREVGRKVWLNWLEKKLSDN